MASSESSSSVNDDILPEDVIRHIISFLPIKEAIKTSILSKRWRFIWTTISNLDFNEYEDDNCSLERYVNSILLQLDPITPIDKISICLQDLDIIQELVSFAAKRNIKDLTLNAVFFDRDADSSIHVIRELFGCKSLQALSLCKLQFQFPKKAFLCFPNLKFLNLESVCISGIPEQGNSPACFPKLKILCLNMVTYAAGGDNCLMGIVHNCPILEDLSIKGYLIDNVSNVDLCIPQLTTADLYLDYDSRVVQIEAPVKYLIIEGWQPHHTIIVKNPDSLIRAKLDFTATDDLYNQGYHDKVLKLKKLFETISKVKFLSLTVRVFKVLRYYGFIIHKSSSFKFPLFNNLIRLEVSMRCKNFYMLESLLKSAVNLQILVIEKLSPTCCKVDDQQLARKNEHLMELSNVPECMISSLKTVEILDSDNCPCEIRMIKTMLYCAKVLEKLFINPYRTNERKNFDSLRQEISAFPRASAMCQIEFPPYSRKFT